LIRAGQRRSLMRRALAEIVPKEVLWRKNKAISSRIQMRAFDIYSEKMEKQLKKAESVEHGYMDSELLPQVIAGLRNGQSEYFRAAIQWLGLELWLLRCENSSFHQAVFRQRVRMLPT